MSLRAPARMPGRPSDRHAVKVSLRRAGLHTVCEEAKCPNICECFGAQTATFLVLGDVCTRNCAFCGVRKGQVGPPDRSEPQRLADAAAELNLTHTVVTSVTRDDLPDGGAGHFAACIEALRRRIPAGTIEVLVPDFGGEESALDLVLDACPDVLNHNLETIERLYPLARPQANMDRSLALLRHVAERGACMVKSGLMVGLGESDSELEHVLSRLAQVGCQVVTIGQYLQPGKDQLEVDRRVHEMSYERYRKCGSRLGLRVVAGPLVRSSWHAREVFQQGT